MLASLLLLAACSPEPPRPAADRAARAAQADAALAKTPVPRTYHIDGHELLVIDVPSRDGLRVETQRCFLWRDAEFKTATMTCPNEPELVPLDRGEPETVSAAH